MLYLILMELNSSASPVYFFIIVSLSFTILPHDISSGTNHLIPTAAENCHLVPFNQAFKFQSIM